MKIRFLSVLIALLCVLILPDTKFRSYAAEKPIRITVATDATWPPMEMIDENKNIVGFDIDFMNAVASEAGLEVKYKNTAWDGIFAGIAAGKYDAIVSSVTILEERKETMDFSIPYISAGQILVVPKHVQGIEALTDFADGAKVGAQIGTISAFEIKKMEILELKAYDDIGLAFEDMAVGRIDGVVCDTAVASNFALKREEYKEKFKIVGKPFTEEHYGIVVRKGNTRLLNLINNGIRAVQEKGIDKELEEKWLK
ncbi:MAG: basic amino acid ABC transporter substrate-binding protein [Syntrophales bacterium]|jgi:polar amino acid transport system substrate-binding protein|nr:basic amino acid ABC transporter substrate-binding protein [Syntrophales bacterium]MDY0045237.1 basic amino acid ABC transporter substrate-binding protein [Syntrophales bacterium]